MEDVDSKDGMDAEPNLGITAAAASHVLKDSLGVGTLLEAHSPDTHGAHLDTGGVSNDGTAEPAWGLAEADILPAAARQCEREAPGEAGLQPCLADSTTREIQTVLAQLLEARAPQKVQQRQSEELARRRGHVHLTGP